MAISTQLKQAHLTNQQQLRELWLIRRMHGLKTSKFHPILRRQSLELMEVSQRLNWSRCRTQARNSVKSPQLIQEYPQQSLTQTGLQTLTVQSLIPKPMNLCGLMSIHRLESMLQVLRTQITILGQAFQDTKSLEYGLLVQTSLM